MKECENRQKTYTIQHSFVGPHESLVDPHRIFIAQKEVTLIANNYVSPGVLFLFNDCVVLGKIIQDKQGAYRFKQKVDFTEIGLKRVNDTDIYTCMWHLKSAEKTYLLKNDTPTERYQLIKSIIDAVNAYRWRTLQVLANQTPTEPRQKHSLRLTMSKDKERDHWVVSQQSLYHRIT